MNTHVFENVWVWIQYIIIEIVYYDKVLYIFRKMLNRNIVQIRIIFLVTFCNLIQYVRLFN